MRRSGSRTEMDVREIRASFLATSAITEQIEEFRRTRLEHVVVDVEGYRFQTEEPFLGDFGNRPIDRDVLLLPEVLVPELPADAATLLRPMFDALWQAAGFERCLDYDKTDAWAPLRRR